MNKRQNIIPFIKCMLYSMILSLLCACTYNNEEDLYGMEKNSCDTAQVSFSDDVFPIIDSNCLPCHAGNSPPLGIDLTGYTGIRQPANDGSLLGSIKHESGYTPMPKNAPQLPKCKIATIEAWINDGMPEN